MNNDNEHITLQHTVYENDKLTESTLPTRSDFHKSKKKKTKFKIKYPIIRLLTAFFIILVISIFSYQFYFEKDANNSIFKQSKDSSAYESVDFAEKAKQGIATNEKNKVENNEQIENKQMEDKPEASDEESAETNTTNASDGTSNLSNSGEDNNGVDTEAANTPQSEPAREGAVGESADKGPDPNYKIVYHTVAANETLFRISIKYYNSRDGEELIKSWNNLNGNNIYEGQVLKIPIKQS